MEQTLYKFMPIGPHFRFNLFMLLEKNSPFFARRRELNDPVDCNPHIVSALEDHELIEATHKACADAADGNAAKTELSHLSDIFRDPDPRRGNLDTLYSYNVFGGISPTAHLYGILKSSEGRPLRELARTILEKYALGELSEPLVFSLSMRRDDSLLWSHYADGHKGVCLELSGLQTAKDGIIQGEVEYSTRRNSITIAEAIGLDANTGQAGETLRKVFFHKSDAWKHEREYRLVARQSPKRVVHPQLRYPEGSFIRLENIEIKSITFGHKCTDQEMVIDLIDQLAQGEKFPRIFQSYQRPSDYQIDFEDISERVLSTEARLAM